MSERSRKAMTRSMRVRMELTFQVAKLDRTYARRERAHIDAQLGQKRPGGERGGSYSRWIFFIF